MSGMQRTALAIVMIGAINWGFIGLFQYDVIAAIFGGDAVTVTRAIYSIVGLAGLYCFTLLFQPSNEPVESPEPMH